MLERKLWMSLWPSSCCVPGRQPVSRERERGDHETLAMDFACPHPPSSSEMRKPVTSFFSQSAFEAWFFLAGIQFWKCPQSRLSFESGKGGISVLKHYRISGLESNPEKVSGWGNFSWDLVWAGGCILSIPAPTTYQVNLAIWVWWTQFSVAMYVCTVIKRY